MLFALVKAYRQRLSLLDTNEADRGRNGRLMATLDNLNHGMGRAAVTFSRLGQVPALHQLHSTRDHLLGRVADITVSPHSAKVS